MLFPGRGGRAGYSQWGCFLPLRGTGPEQSPPVPRAPSHDLPSPLTCQHGHPLAAHAQVQPPAPSVKPELGVLLFGAWGPGSQRHLHVGFWGETGRVSVRRNLLRGRSDPAFAYEAGLRGPAQGSRTGLRRWARPESAWPSQEGLHGRTQQSSLWLLSAVRPPALGSAALPKIFSDDGTPCSPPTSVTNGLDLSELPLG